MKSSIDQEELAKFNKLSDHWWDTNGVFKILHQINPIRLEFIQNKITSHFKIGYDSSQFRNLTVLDIGCGGGLVTTQMHKLGFDVTGIDSSMSNINVARDYAIMQKMQINYMNTTAEELVAENLQYDIVLCLELVEHVANVDEFIKNVAALVKQGGMIILSTFNRTVKSYLLGIVAAEYLLKWVPRNTHTHRKFLKPSELYHLFKANNISLKQLRGLTFNILLQAWQLTDDISVNYLMYASKI